MPYQQKPGRGPMMKTGRGLRKDLLGPAAHEPGHEKPDPKLTESEKKFLDSDQLSDANTRKLVAARGADFRKMREKLMKEQRAADSSYIVTHRTIKDLKPLKQASGHKSSSIVSPQGPSRPSKFRRDKYGNIEAY